MKLTIFMPVTESYLITKVRAEENLRYSKDHPRLANIALGLESCLHMGNIDAMRDWGHAKVCSDAMVDAPAR